MPHLTKKHVLDGNEDFISYLYELYNVEEYQKIQVCFDNSVESDLLELDIIEAFAADIPYKGVKVLRFKLPSKGKTMELFYKKELVNFTEYTVEGLNTVVKELYVVLYLYDMGDEEVINFGAAHPDVTIIVDSEKH